MENSIDILNYDTKEIIYDNLIISLTKDLDSLIIQIKEENSIFQYENKFQESSLNQIPFF